MNKIKKFFRKEYQKFQKKSWLGKITDLLLILVILMMLFPGTRKQLLTYGSKIRMYLTSVDMEESPEAFDGNLLFQTAQGEHSRLEEYTDKPVFINYWATWCPPCRAEMPALEKLYKQYGNDVNFLFVSGEPLSKQKQFLSKNGYDIPFYHLRSRPTGDLSYQALPTSVLLSRDNRIVFRKEGAVNWQSKKVKEIFRKVSTDN